ncbi:hypothetical protein HMPREF0083_02808, partial [Aneurinibacillus aneurinilyticus ATCC 12856]
MKGKWRILFKETNRCNILNYRYSTTERLMQVKFTIRKMQKEDIQQVQQV